jgi:gluconolactonase
VADPKGTTEHMPIGELAITNLCFGGAGMRDVWVTAPAPAGSVRARWPRPGLKLGFKG